jgi:glutathionylspermidine synthase
MLRKTFKKRADYRQRLNEIGFQYHSVLSGDGEEYWAEGVAYEFTLERIEQIEAASENLHEMCLETVGDIIESGDYPSGFKLSEQSKRLIEHSWRNGDLHVYGRFDLLVEPDSNNGGGGGGAIKLYEYNADTPTALLEAAVAQWQWLEEAEEVPHRDQFNSIHEKLVARWRQAKSQAGFDDPTLYVLASREGAYEDWGNVEYMADTAVQGGWRVHIEEIENLGYDSLNGTFVDAAEMPIEYAFKLYPWEWMMEESFGARVIDCPTQWFEPPWKMLLSNKAILPVLWQRYPNHPNLLPAFFEDEKPAASYRYMFVKKPILGREGANIQLAGTFSDTLINGSHQTPEYDRDGYIYQEYAPLPNFAGRHPVVGSWIVGDEPAGIGIREDAAVVTGNGSHFVPHYFVIEEKK